MDYFTTNTLLFRNFIFRR